MTDKPNKPASEPLPRVRIMPADFELTCQPGQTVLEAAIERGAKMRQACRNGVCEICVADVIHGQFQLTSNLGQALLDQKRQVLCCLAQPLTDCELHMPSVAHPDKKPLQSYSLQIASVEETAEDLFVIKLLAPAGKSLDFWPGQYLMLEIPKADGEERSLPYSIASAPGSLTGQDPRGLELHIARAGDTAAEVITYLQNETLVKASLPMGDCCLLPQDLKAWADQPILLVAAGTGFAQIKSLAEGILAQAPEQEVHIYWSNRGLGGFYLPELPLDWVRQYENLTYHPIVEQPDESWEGRDGWIYQVIEQDFDDLSDVQMFACGSPNMVHGTLDQLEKRGLSEANMHSDVFAYAPRQKNSDHS